jgi:hypothetical protein
MARASTALEPILSLMTAIVLKTGHRPPTSSPTPPDEEARRQAARRLRPLPPARAAAPVAAMRARPLLRQHSPTSNWTNPISNYGDVIRSCFSRHCSPIERTPRQRPLLADSNATADRPASRFRCCMRCSFRVLEADTLQADRRPD